MKQFFVPLSFCLTIASSIVAAPIHAAQPLYVAYPPANHETTSDRIFLIGTAPPGGTVLVNGTAIVRNTAGHFAPTFPLQVGVNQFDLRYGKQAVKLTVTRLAAASEPPQGLTFGTLSPAVDVARLPNELLCFTAIAPPTATVAVKLADQTIPLVPRPQSIALPDNAAVLTQQNQPTIAAGRFEGCTRTVLLGDLGKPEWQLTQNGQTIKQTGFGSIKILSPTRLETAVVTAEAGTARTGAGTDYSRLTPLPKGTQALVTGSEGDWVRLDYGAWIRRSEVQILSTGALPTSLIRSIKARQTGGWTEVMFPLQVPVPVSVQQGDRTFTLILYNTTAQTDIIRLDDDPLIARLDWQQSAPGQIQYTFNLKSSQQWGYKLRYEGTTLVLSLKHPPTVGSREPGAGSRGAGEQFKTLSGTKILLDPGHGGAEDLGSRGPTGYPEKTVALLMAKLVRERLQQRGATVYLTRETDVDVPLQDRVAMIEKVQPTVALSLHYNALPDNGDAVKTKGISMFWYNTQAHSLAVFLHNHLTKTLKRSSYGVFWNNLALTRPATTPAVLLELGFMINPDEFEWITNPREQQRLATAIADGVTLWLQKP
ncbi:N-acetylmuramoyl-L-alanine amidase [Phormidium sp. FACHB-592]|uniref:N-acetylmuramoyl-L-alanine amidase n=1 Tax=Stenomitos frigidus AS-A4 TaxID=2933935 RepID=A0ABV0KQ03_9CYAN|nr:N-acetylmuramoyl-L-alanine amidase [Phormidium sp. FACHB-592]MBD2075177.1 N-acetylmuramoyl-L-alanine amidase [Phormidium sp. FACHB-592]